MARAVILIRSGGRVPNAVELANVLKRFSFVTDAYAVFGRVDVVAFLEGRDVKELFRSVSEVTKIEGIMSSESLIDAESNGNSMEYGKGPFSS